MRVPPYLRLLCALPLLAGCAAGARGPARPAPGVQCRLAPVPEQLPAAAALVDTAALDTAVAAVAGHGPGHVLLSMSYAPDGANVRRSVVDHSLSPAVADSVQALVFAHRRTLPPQEAEWGVRLRIDLDGRPRYQVARREVCAPRLRFHGTASPDGAGSPFERYAPLHATMRTVWVRVRLDELGRVAAASVDRALLRRASDEMVILNYVYSLTFDPAREDGVPVPGEVGVPVRVPW